MGNDDIIKIIDAAADRLGFKPSTICQYAVGNAKLYARLKSGSACSTKTVERLNLWIKEQKPNPTSVTSIASVKSAAALSKLDTPQA